MPPGVSLPIIVVRPPPGDAETAARAAALGMGVVRAPLFAVEPLAWDVPDAGGFDAVLIGSANALRHGGAGLAALAGLPAHVVGEATARAAREAGFRVATVGGGTLQPVLAAAASAGRRRLLRLAGEARVPLRLPPGVAMATRVLYRVTPQPIPRELAAALARGALVLLHSGEAAAHFAAEVDRLALPRARIALAALAPRIAERAGAGWARRAVAARPDDGVLLALARQMCKERA